MLVHKCFASAALTLGLAGLAAGVWLLSARPEHAVVAAADPPAAAKDQGAAGTRKMIAALQQRISLDEIEANTPVKDVIKLLSERTKVAILFNVKDFEEIGVQKVEEQPVALAKVQNVKLGTVLRLLLKQIKGDAYTGAYLVRSDHLELTTDYHQQCAAGAAPLNLNPVTPGTDNEEIVTKAMGYLGTYRPMTAIVQLDSEGTPLAQALHQVAADTGFDVVIDPRVAEKARTPVTMTATNIWLDNAADLLVEVAELDWYWMDKVIFVTSRDNARQRRERIKTMLRERAQFAAQLQEPTRGLVSVNCTNKPLADALAGLAGVQTVIDPRVDAKAKAAAVTLQVERVPPETAVRLLADLAGLAAVPLDRAIYITSKDNAKTMARP